MILCSQLTVPNPNPPINRGCLSLWPFGYPKIWILCWFCKNQVKYREDRCSKGNKAVHFLVDCKLVKTLVILGNGKSIDDLGGL